MVNHFLRKNSDGADAITKYFIAFLAFLGRVEHRALWISRYGAFALYPHRLVRHQVGENVLA